MLTIGVYPRPGWLLRDFLTGWGRNWGGMEPRVAGCSRPRIESCTMQISLVCIIARDRADHSSIDRSVPAVDLPRPSSAARQGGNDGGRSIRSIMAGVPFAQPHPFPTSAPQSKFLLGGRVSPHASWTDVKSSLAKSNNVRNDGFNNTPHASPRCAPRGVSSFLGIAMERSRS